MSESLEARVETPSLSCVDEFDMLMRIPDPLRSMRLQDWLEKHFGIASEPLRLMSRRWILRVHLLGLGTHDWEWEEDGLVRIVSHDAARRVLWFAEVPLSTKFLVDTLSRYSNFVQNNVNCRSRT